MRRYILILVLSFVFLALCPGIPTIQAQPYPNRPIQLIIPNVAGSIMDMNARALADELGKNLGTQIIPMNKPGAASAVGTNFLAKSKKDGYTLGHASNAAENTLDNKTIVMPVEKPLTIAGQRRVVGKEPVPGGGTAVEFLVKLAI